MIDYRDWGVPLGRRFRALKLWFVLRSYGVARLQAMLRDHIAWTAELAQRIEAEPDFELVTPPRLALLTFRYRPPGHDDEAALDRLQRAPAARPQRRRPRLPDPDPRARPLRDPVHDRPAHHHPRPRRPRLAGDHGDRARPAGRRRLGPGPRPKLPRRLGRCRIGAGAPAPPAPVPGLPNPSPATASTGRSGRRYEAPRMMATQPWIGAAPAMAIRYAGACVHRSRRGGEPADQRLDGGRLDAPRRRSAPLRPDFLKSALLQGVSAAAAAA